jgi:Family of unknown function (DUF6790)
MTVFAVRVFLFSILPLILGAGIVLFDRSGATRERRLEVLLIMLFGLGVAGSGIASFFGHVFLSDVVAESVGWPTGSPFQLEMGFSNLALGCLGVVAAGRRDGFREATVIAVTVLGIGASFVHLQDIWTTGNLAPGNTVQNVANLIKPACLIPLLLASRRMERADGSESHTRQFEHWRTPLLRTVAVVTPTVATGFAIGFAVGEVVLVSAAAAFAALAVTVFVLARAPSHRASG